MIIWVDQAIAQRLTIQGHMVQEKAKWFAGRLGVKDFNASDGWLAKFKKRNRLSSYKRRGESASAPIEEIPRFRAELQESILQKISSTAMRRRFFGNSSQVELSPMDL